MTHTRSFKICAQTDQKKSVYFGMEIFHFQFRSATQILNFSNVKCFSDCAFLDSPGIIQVLERERADGTGNSNLCNTLSLGHLCPPWVGPLQE
jgi:hypothetical protein